MVDCEEMEKGKAEIKKEWLTETFDIQKIRKMNELVERKMENRIRNE